MWWVQVKVLCSSGGCFKKAEGGLEYTGGETRLVSVSNDCHMRELQDALHRVSQTMRLDLSGSSSTVCRQHAIATNHALVMPSAEPYAVSHYRQAYVNVST